MSAKRSPAQGLEASKPEAVFSWFERNRERIVSEWFAFLRFPSVSTDPRHKQDCRNCAEWIRDYLDTLGMKAKLLETSGHPVVYGASAGRRDGPRVLFYGHYDVQPAAPEREWDSPPFDPEIRDGRVYARGAQDNKGQLFYFLQAMAFLREQGVNLPDLRIVLDGEEECGSPGMTSRLADWRRLVAADVLMVCDTCADDRSGRPAIIAGLRGMLHFEVVARGADRDLHSGMHGGVAPNPVHAMNRMLASLRDRGGRIRVKGFMDYLRPANDHEKGRLAGQPWDEAEYRRRTGVRPTGGERRLPALERLGFRPTIEVNGIEGGGAGEGFKTIIPAECRAKISCRLCPDQNPSRCLEAIKDHFHKRCPPGIRLVFENESIDGPGFRLPVGSPIFRMAEEVLRNVDVRGPAYLWEGASIPVIGALRDISGAAPLLVGFGSDADRIHASNESFSLRRFRQGLLYCASMLHTLAGGA